MCARAWRSFAACTSAGSRSMRSLELCALEKLAGRDNRKLSGGQQQRLLLAIALVNDPQVLFLDEPTTGLDPQARRNFWELVESIKARRKTIILTTHYMEEAQLLCDEIAIMDRGHIIAQGAPQQLLREHFAEVLLELPRHEFPEAARRLPLKVIDAGRPRGDQHARSRRRHCARSWTRKCRLRNLRIRPRQSRGSFPRPHRQGPARMMKTTLLAVWHARNLEFLRDRPTLIFTLLLPVGVVIGMGFIFGGPPRPLFKVGVLGATVACPAPIPFSRSATCNSCPIHDEAAGLPEVTHQRDRSAPRSATAPCATGSTPIRPRATSWRSSSSPPTPARGASPSRGRRSRYVDWLFPGILGNEHDVQLPLRGRLRRVAIPQERLPQAPARDARSRRSSF